MLHYIQVKIVFIPRKSHGENVINLSVRVPHRKISTCSLQFRRLCHVEEYRYAVSLFFFPRKTYHVPADRSRQEYTMP